MNERISVFDIIKIGIGPSSSHTMGPWKAAAMALDEVRGERVSSVRADLYGSLAKTGAGHGTHLALLMALAGESYLTVDTSTVIERARAMRAAGAVPLGGGAEVPVEIVLHPEALPAHPNGMRFTFSFEGGGERVSTYYSVGGGFVVRDGEVSGEGRALLPYPIDTAAELLAHARSMGGALWQVVFENEKAWRSPEAIAAELDRIWEAMRACVHRGCSEEGQLPGGLRVKRRAAEMARKLLGLPPPASPVVWFAQVGEQKPLFQTVLRWVSCFALAANEENAAFGRIVTAPTNGACGVIPAVLLYMTCFCDRASRDDVHRFLMVAGEIGSLFKKGATISAAMGGCQAEIGVSSAMAAAALAEGLGGSPEQALMAAEIAMEHHLGMTCDPIGGLVQVPCIERNSMGAVKAITAANIALESDPAAAKVSLDAVIRSMWSTAQDMSSKYKETAEGGLAVQIPVSVAEC